MTAIRFTPTPDWTAASRFTALIDTPILLSNAGESAISWTLTDSDTPPTVEPRDANILTRAMSFQMLVPVGQRLWLAKRGVDSYLESVVNIERGVPYIFPPAMITDDMGPNQRLRVDVAQTGFFAGREFRTFREWDTATTGSFVIKTVVPVDTILFELGFTMEAGVVKMETVAGGTPGGVFAETLPIFSSNNMAEKPQPPYVNQLALTAGGTHTGGVILDVLRGKTADNSNFASSLGLGSGAERGIAVGTYHFRLTLTSFIGVLKGRWEERP